MSKIKLVFATGLYREFGNGDSLPWNHLAIDFKQFKEDTLNSIVVMGGATWKSLPKALPKRINVVLSRDPVWNKADEVPDIRMKGDLQSIIQELKTNYPDKDICIIGGVSLIKEAIDFADEVHISTIVAVDGPFPHTVDMPLEVLVKLDEQYKEFKLQLINIDENNISMWSHRKLKRK